MRKLFKILLSVLVIVSLCTACAARLPNPKTARGVSMSFFKKYGRKYPTTPFGQKNLDNVTINNIEEISYKFALADTIVTFVDGHAGRALIRMENRFPGGWRVISWEMLGYK
ncbi:MAG: hypothetical protein HQM16_10570 [Deltaproteobacteria bacterium]|nr:hypothetical protein [Deltaproteobacteria bacterium]